jgi:polyisoprenoid-binding protein YceI
VTEALRSPSLLDVEKHPKMTFRSTKITGTPKAAKIDGILTVKGISKPVQLDARLLRCARCAEDDFSKLVIDLKGSINRFDFKVDGFPKLVGPTIKLNMRVRLLQE